VISSLEKYLFNSLPDLGLAKEEEFADLLAVGGDDEVSVLQVALLLLGFLCQDVAVISVVTLDLTRSGEHESLLCCGISLYFWHFFVWFKLLFNARTRLRIYRAQRAIRLLLLDDFMISDK